MADGNGSGTRGHVVLAWSPNGWLLRERDGDPPRVGSELEDGEHILVVTRHGASPLPGDSRPCAFTTSKF